MRAGAGGSRRFSLRPPDSFGQPYGSKEFDIEYGYHEDGSHEYGTGCFPATLADLWPELESYLCGADGSNYQESYDGHQPSYEGYWRSYVGHQQSYDGCQLSYDRNQHCYDDHLNSYDGDQKSYDDNQKNHEGYQQSYDGDHQS